MVKKKAEKKAKPLIGETAYEPDDMKPQEFGIPAGIRKANTELVRGCYWIHGPPKIGKTTLANSFPGVWFFGTERGQEWQDVQDPFIVSSWEHFTGQCAWIEENKPTKFGDGTPIRFVAIDTVDLLFKMCGDQICLDLGIEDPSELEHGKAWARLGNEFSRVMTKIARWPFGLILISHSTEKEIKQGIRKVTRVQPQIGMTGYKVVEAMSDLILYCHKVQVAEENDQGVATGVVERWRMLAHPASHTIAGGRMSHRLPALLPMSYAALNKAMRGEELTEEDEVTLEAE